mgnify:FL=1|jgi:3-oxoacyl-[acyl-carrier-protein] synthase II
MLVMNGARAKMRRRIVITGTGMITPLGHSVSENWENLKSGCSGVGQITLFDASKFKTRIAAEVRDFEFHDYFPQEPQWEFVGRNAQFVLAAAKQAVEESGIDASQMDPTRLGVYLGSGEGEQDFAQCTGIVARAIQSGTLEVSEFMAGILEQLHPIDELEKEPNMPTAHVAHVFGAEGPNLNCLTACAASSQAIGEASEIIRSGGADVMISGGTHSMIHPFGLTGFSLLGALSVRNDQPQEASRPFDRDRDGFVLGEGSGIVILEELEHAKRRGAPILGELMGFGSSADAHRLTDSHPEGRGAASSIESALTDGQMNRDEIGYVNSHGTSTAVNDRIETLAVRRVFKDRADNLPVSSIKSMLGHLIAAAGAVELATCLMAIRDGVLPPTINYTTPDPECDLDYIPNEAREVKLDTALSNSFGFGGQNIALIVRRFSG